MVISSSRQLNHEVLLTVSSTLMELISPCTDRFGFAVLLLVLTPSPNPPRITLQNERPMPAHITYERIAPVLPTRAPEEEGGGGGGGKCMGKDP